MTTYPTFTDYQLKWVKGHRPEVIPPLIGLRSVMISTIACKTSLFFFVKKADLNKADGMEFGKRKNYEDRIAFATPAGCPVPFKTIDDAVRALQSFGKCK